MAELEMLPSWAGRLAEPAHPPQPPTPPRRHATDEAPPTDLAEGSAVGGGPGVNGDGPVSANGHGPAVLAGQPPLPSGAHRLGPDTPVPPAVDGFGSGDQSGEADDDFGSGDRSGDDGEGRVSASAMPTSELPVVSIPFDDETTTLAPELSVPVDDSLIDTLETPLDDLVALEAANDDVIVDAELVDDGPAGEAPPGEGLLDGDQQPTDSGHPHEIVHEADEIVYEPDEIELLPEDADPIGRKADDNSPVVAPVTAPDPELDRPQGRRDEEPEHDRPALRVLSLLALALLVVAAGVAAGYLFVALSGS